ncbi:MAG: DUF308 domain-containing protein [Paracoccaceae bacterium]|nr:DUF308 domain-containing protein [Paracoccaceae bacterium]
MAFQYRRSPLHDSGLWMIGFGIIALIAGALAFYHPFAASLTVVSFAALRFIVLGILKALYAVRLRNDDSFIVSLILAALFIFLGFGLWSNPIAGLLSLTALVAVFFIAIGIFKAAFAMRIRPASGWGWVMLSGLVSLLLGGMILANFPMSAATILGLLLGIELLSTGIAFVMAGLTLRRL